MKNREEWEARGHEIVMEMHEAMTNAKKDKQSNQDKISQHIDETDSPSEH
jgi:hypothetical protein